MRLSVVGRGRVFVDFCMGTHSPGSGNDPDADSEALPAGQRGKEVSSDLMVRGPRGNLAHSLAKIVRYLLIRVLFLP